MTLRIPCSKMLSTLVLSVLSLRELAIWTPTWRQSTVCGIVRQLSGFSRWVSKSPSSQINTGRPPRAVTLEAHFTRFCKTGSNIGLEHCRPPVARRSCTLSRPGPWWSPWSSQGRGPPAPRGRASARQQGCPHFELFVNSYWSDFGSYVVGVYLPVQVGQLLDFECTLKASGVTVPENQIIMQKWFETKSSVIIDSLSDPRPMTSKDFCWYIVPARAETWNNHKVDLSQGATVQEKRIWMSNKWLI